MARPVRRVASLLLAAAVAAAWLPPAMAAKEPNPIVQLAKKLAQPADFPGFEADPKVIFLEALDKLADNYGVTFHINEAAFRAEMVEDVSSKPVAEKPIPKMTKVSLDTVLRKVLERIPSQSGATYVLRRDGIEITTWTYKLAEFYPHLYENPPAQQDDRSNFPLSYLFAPPLVQAEFDRRPLEDALKELADATDWCVVLDEAVLDKSKPAPVTATLLNVPLDTAVKLLADMAGLAVLDRDRALYVTTKVKADALRKELPARVPPPNALGGVAPQAELAKTQAEVAKLQAEVARLQAELARLRPRKTEPKQAK